MPISQAEMLKAFGGRLQASPLYHKKGFVEARRRWRSTVSDWGGQRKRGGPPPPVAPPSLGCKSHRQRGPTRCWGPSLTLSTLPCYTRLSLGPLEPAPSRRAMQIPPLLVSIHARHGIFVP